VGILPGFVGPASTLRSPNVNDEELINWMVSAAPSGTPKAPVWLCPTPGYHPFLALGQGPVRGVFEQDGVAFAVGGGNLYKVLSRQIARGIAISPAIRTDTRPTTFATFNKATGHQLIFPSGNLLYLYDYVSDTLVNVPLDWPVTMVDFIDGRFLGLEALTNKFHWSDLENGLSWPSLNFAQLVQSSDNIVALKAIHGQIWLWGTKTTVVWDDVGGLQVFAPIPGSLMQQGCAAAFSVQVIDNAPFWLGSNEFGAGKVYRGQGVGAVPIVVSTSAVDYDISKAHDLSGCVAFTYEQEEHAFYVLYIPGRPWHWAYDVTTREWHKRARWDPVAMQWTPDLPWVHMYAFGKHLVGARNSDVLYEMSVNFGSNRVVV